MPDPFAIVIPAAGISARFGGSKNKLEEELLGERVWVRSVKAFLQRADVGTVIVVVRDVEGMASAFSDDRVRFTTGGACRAESVWNGLRAVPPDYDWVAVHDAARPLVSQTLITRTFDTARRHGAAVPGLPIHLTVRRATGQPPRRSQGVVDRAELWGMQTPQAARREDLLRAFEHCAAAALDQLTDDLQPLERLGHEVRIIDGEERNLKITTRADLALAEWWLENP